MTSNSFYWSPFFFSLPVFMVVMCGGPLSVNLVLEKDAGQDSVGGFRCANVPNHEGLRDWFSYH